MPRGSDVSQQLNRIEEALTRIEEKLGDHSDRITSNEVKISGFIKTSLIALVAVVAEVARRVFGFIGG
jgi:hypothetical protein